MIGLSIAGRAGFIFETRFTLIITRYAQALRGRLFYIGILTVASVIIGVKSSKSIV